MQEKIPKIRQNLKKKTDRVMSIHALLQKNSVFYGMLLHAAGQYAAIASEAVSGISFFIRGSIPLRRSGYETRKTAV